MQQQQGDLSLIHNEEGNESGIDAPAPKLVRGSMKKVLVAAMCLTAILAGVAVVGGKQKVNPPSFTAWNGFIGLDNKHVTKECIEATQLVDALYESRGKKHTQDDHDVECDEEEQTCKVTIEKPEWKSSKCLPKVCKQEDMKKEFEDHFPQSKVDFVCE
mmetsp:Transcript_117887/g.229208  ORF Transcript_117887/g.229208 Transcript_117887/m.229208 type:complete len:159 (-) Transcript_117887:59-535(-)|eukprot:CAMPEP_0172669730 /NCGR_PEP_ID=MMETSP1074-20121228/9866_1 /TAXON_ID=2916 /ORGANISM="Ceratium fusus, Strain PA161109" /LENGTH=158 /DNA_ID=CAMNT_0013486545 /DNA_START=62 /DNA_END=538 /DNA_ORIENTATION=-